MTFFSYRQPGRRKAPAFYWPKHLPTGTNFAAYPKSSFMENKKQQAPLDPHLDVPAEANTEKHINFLDDEGPGQGEDREERHRNEERRRQWENGLEKGRENRSR